MMFGTFKNTVDSLWNRYQFIVDNSKVKVSVPELHKQHKRVDADSVDWCDCDGYYKVMDAACACWFTELSNGLLSKDMSDEEFVELYEGILAHGDLSVIDKVVGYRNDPHTMDYDTHNFFSAPYECFPGWGVGNLSRFYLDKNFGFKDVILWNE